MRPLGLNSLVKSSTSIPVHIRRQIAAAGLSTQVDPIQDALMKEECLLVDENDNVTGHASKRHCHRLDSQGNSPLHRAFSLFLFDSENRLLLQQRSDAKITFPGLWTNTCCSHPLAVENEMDLSQEAIGVKRAAQRKILQELGIPPNEVPVENMTYLTRILYAAKSNRGDEWGEHELDYILFYKVGHPNLTVEPNPNEVKDIKYVSLTELDHFLSSQQEAGHGITPWFKHISDTFLKQWWENLERIDELKNHQDVKKF